MQKPRNHIACWIDFQRKTILSARCWWKETVLSVIPAVRQRVTPKTIKAFNQFHHAIQIEEMWEDIIREKWNRVRALFYDADVFPRRCAASFQTL